MRFMPHLVAGGHIYIILYTFGILCVCGVSEMNMEFKSA